MYIPNSYDVAWFTQSYFSDSFCLSLLQNGILRVSIKCFEYSLLQLLATSLASRIIVVFMCVI